VTQVAPMTHEVEAFLDYAPVETHPNAMVDYDGLAPYEFCSKLLIEHADGYHEVETTINGESVVVQLNFSPSGFVPTAPLDFDAERLYEFEVHVDGRGRRKADYNISPRYESLRNADGDSVSTAFDHYDQPRGVNVHAQSSNVRVDEVPSLLRSALHELAQDLGTSMFAGYFQQPIGGRITEFERYVRYQADYEQKIIGTGGVFDQLVSHLSDGAETKGEVKWDNEGRKGKYHCLKHSSTDAERLVSRHRYGGQLKNYLPKHPEKFDPQDPLYHPKLGTKFIQKWNTGGAVDWDDRHDLVQELDERLLSVLSWADMPLDGGTTFVADDHFKARPAADPVPLHADPLPELEARDELLLTDALREMTDADEEMARTLVADGGMHVDDLAERHDRGLSTVYRMLDRLDGVLESKNGHVQFVSEHVRHELRAVVESMEDRVRSAAERVSRLVDIDAHQRHASAFDEALARYAAEFERGADGTPTVRIGARLSRYARTSSDPTVADVLDELLSAWRDDDRDPILLRQGTFVASVDGDRRERSIAAEIDNGRRGTRTTTPD